MLVVIVFGFNIYYTELNWESSTPYGSLPLKFSEDSIQNIQRISKEQLVVGGYRLAALLKVLAKSIISNTKTAGAAEKGVKKTVLSFESKTNEEESEVDDELLSLLKGFEQSKDAVGGNIEDSKEIGEKTTSEIQGKIKEALTRSSRVDLIDEDLIDTENRKRKRQQPQEQMVKMSSSTFSSDNKHNFCLSEKKDSFGGWGDTITLVCFYVSLFLLWKYL